MRNLVRHEQHYQKTRSDSLKERSSPVRGVCVYTWYMCFCVYFSLCLGGTWGLSSCKKHASTSLVATGVEGILLKMYVTVI
jgi:hypothetical protein